MHYNGRSTGSFVDKTLNQFKHLSTSFEFIYFVNEEGYFTDTLRSAGAEVTIWPLHELNICDPKTLIQAGKFYRFLRAKQIDLVYLLDFVHWHPIELHVAKLLRIPTVLFCGFYKDDIFRKSFLKYCSQIVTNSDATASRIANGRFLSKTKVIHNSIDCSKYSSPQFRHENLNIGFIGSLIPIKGIEDLLHAMPKIISGSSINKLLIAGSDRDNTGYKHQLKQMTADLQIAEKVEFLGHVEPANFFKQVDILIVPSKDEPFGYINIEAGASGIPVIATNVGGIPEIIIDRKTGILIPANSPDAIAEACLELANSTELRAELGKNAKIRTSNFFSHHVTMPQWEAVFKKNLMNKSG